MDYITFDVYLYGNVTGGKDSRRHMETRPQNVRKMLPGLIIHSPPCI